MRDVAVIRRAQPGRGAILASPRFGLGAVAKAHASATEPAHQRYADWIRLIVFRLDGKRVITVSRNGTACIWDAATGAAIGTPLRLC